MVAAHVGVFVWRGCCCLGLGSSLLGLYVGGEMGGELR